MYDFIVGMCLYSGIRDVTFQSFERLRLGSNYKYKVEFENRGAPIGRERSVVASRFLKKNESPYLIFIDGDILFHPKDIQKLLEAMQQGYEIIAGGYLVSDMKNLAIRTWTPENKLDGLIHDAEYISTGFMGMTRHALESIRDGLKLPLLHEGQSKECWPFFESRRDLKNKFYLSEDWDICLKAREVGLRTYFHSGILLPHMKEILLSPRNVTEEETNAA
jgi:glycosyltransferase involved in cell wall biosynthesis